MSRRLRETALLILLAALAAVGIEALAAGTPLRIAAGIALLLALPWLAASRLRALRGGPTGSRLASSGALAFALIVLLGLLLSTLDAGITTGSLMVGAAIFTATLALLGAPAEPSPSHRARGLSSLLGPALIVVAIAISVFAFLLARDRALTQAREETSFAAFLIEEGDQLGVGLKNSSSRAARFAVRDLSRGPASAIVVRVPAHNSRVLPDFVAQPPPLRPRQRLDPKPAVDPVIVRVDVSVDGRRTGPPLKLSTFAP